MPGVADLTAHMGYLLRMTSNAVSQQFARKLASERVTVAEWVMLRSLYGSDAIAPSALAQKMGMTKGAISKLTDRLLEKGLIERAGDPDDKRRHALSLSAKGLRIVPLLADHADQNDTAFFAVLTAEEQEALRAVLHTLIDRHGLSAMPVD